MKFLSILLLWTLLSSNSIGQWKIESFPNLADFIDTAYSRVDNIFPIAIISLTLDGKKYKIPISYSMFHDSVDSNYFLIKGDYINCYSFKVLENGKCKPIFKKEALLLPTDWKPFLTNTRQKFDSIKSKLDLNNYLKFIPEPKWWQDDATPLTEDRNPMKFICQLELGDFTSDDCCLFIFFDSKRQIVKQIYQRD